MKKLNILLFFAFILIMSSCKKVANTDEQNHCNNLSAIEFGKKIIENTQVKSFKVIFPPDDSIGVTWKGDTAIISSTYFAYGLDSTAFLTSEYQILLLCEKSGFVSLGKSEKFEIQRAGN